MKIRRKTIYAAFIISALTYTPTLAAQTGRQEFKAGQQEQIRAVGRALLQANRGAKPDKNVDLLREDVKQAHVLLKELVQPFGADQARLTIQRQGKKIQPARIGDKWIQARAGRIAQLKQVFSKLADRSRLLASEKSASRSSRKNLQTGVVSQLDTTKVAGQVLARLENLQSLMDEALLLPPGERIKSLESLTNDLTIGPNPVSMLTTERPETPTITTRTRHRRSGNR